MFQGSENSRLRVQRGAAGFTLIEVMIAMVVLAIGLLAMAQLQVTAIRGLTYSRHFSVATQLAEAQLETLMNYPFPNNEVGNMAYCPLDENGSNITANATSGTAVSPFFDTIVPQGTDTNGDGLATRLWLAGPVNEHGDPAKVGEQAYVITWTVERGGSKGTPPPVGQPYKEPGQYQVKFVVSAIWFEKGDKFSAWNYPHTDPLAPGGSKRTTIESIRLLDSWTTVTP